MTLQANLNAVLHRIDDAARRSGRTGTDVRLICVTKYVEPSIAAQLVALGQFDLGEARPQELWRKTGALPDTAIRWHLIGHLQGNKVRRTLPLLSLLHSIDSERLLRTVDQEAEILKLRPRVLLEVNISGDTAKHGFPPDELARIIHLAAELPNVQIVGLMGMSALEGGLEVARRNFASLRLLRDRMLPYLPPSVKLHELSMGMSDDFEIAIEEGATMVRVGSALFE
jgi:pyridoxal phosphate enzyme (YggS family)